MDLAHRRRRASAPLAALLAAVLLAALAAVPVQAGADDSPDGDAPADAGELLPSEPESASVVEIFLESAEDAQRLAATGTDLANITDEDGALLAHAVVTPSEQAALEAQGFEVGATVYTDADWQERIAEREALVEAKEQGLTSGPTEAPAGWTDSATSTPLGDPLDDFANQPQSLSLGTSDDVSTAQTDDVIILRADYYEGKVGNNVNAWVYVEAKTSDGQTQSFPLTVHRDSGPGTEIGSGGTNNIGRFTDAGQYMYHRGASSTINVRPEYVRVTSPNGGSAVARVSDWLPIDEDEEEGAPYLVDFVDHYMTPNELYDRIHELAEQYPDIAEIVELPYETNGYRRHAQVLHGTTTSNAIVVTSHVYGHEGGNDITVDFVNPGAASQPLTVSVDGDDITVSLATDAGGNLSSTVAQVVAAVNDHTEASALVHAHTFRGNAGNGTKQAGGPNQLSDFLSAPDSVSREPQTVYALRIGKQRDGSNMGVLAYAQEHAREWQTPLVVMETAERLLHNYASHGATRQLVNNLDIFLMPSHNPDGANYSFYDFASQRKNMTKYCPTTGAADPNARNSWGVDNNRNYAAYTSHPPDAYSGGSGSCTSGTFRGPSELSEPESRNLVWLADENPHVRFAMNLHSFGDYFMWSPGSYRTPGRVPAPRPTLAEEDYFWQASERILTEIKRHRGTVVVPQRTGPIIDVLYSAAGNSGDHLWYLNDIYAWNFEVGRAGFQPAWPEAHQQAMEYANGLIEMFHVARDFDRDSKRPRSRVTPGEGTYDGPVEVEFELSEPADVYYTLDGSRPTYDSPVLSATGVREPAETFTITETTTIQWFSVDQAGNVENNYDPDSPAQNFNKATIGID